MIYNIVFMTLCIVSFFFCVGAYCLGHKHARKIEKGIIPKMQFKPFKTDPTSKAKELEEELTDIMSITREDLLKHIEKGV